MAWNCIGESWEPEWSAFPPTQRKTFTQGDVLGSIGVIHLTAPSKYGVKWSQQNWTTPKAWVMTFKVWGLHCQFQREKKKLTLVVLYSSESPTWAFTCFKLGRATSDRAHWNTSVPLAMVIDLEVTQIGFSKTSESYLVIEVQKAIWMYGSGSWHFISVLGVMLRTILSHGERENQDK